MMRRNSCLLLGAVLAGTVLLPAAAQAKGSHLRFAQEQYAPGDHAVGRAEVETWKGSGQPEDGPYSVYLVRGRQPLWFGHLPSDAIQVGELHIGALLAPDTYRVKVAFEVPRVPDGPYEVWVCGARSGGTGCWLGFGDLVYGRIVVARESPADRTAAPHELAAPSTPQIPTRRVPFSWVVLALSGLATAVLAGALHAWRQRRRMSA